MNLDEEYWTNRYKHGMTGWNIGHASPPLKEYIDQLSNKSLSILIPGAGYGHEGAYAWKSGFSNLTIIDISKEPIKRIKRAYPELKDANLICEDFFQHQGQYDIILEQTFFCALAPSLRPKYVEKMASLLKENGKLVGVLFSRLFDRPGPPFGGTKEEYVNLFSQKFKHCFFESCHNSIAPRLGSELFFNCSIQKS